MEEESERESQYSPSEKSTESSDVVDALDASSSSRVRDRRTNSENGHEGEERGTTVPLQSQQQNANSQAVKQDWGKIDLQAYRELLNHTVREIVNNEDGYEASPLTASQVGCMIWSAKEKESLYYALDRKGIDDVRALSDAIKTKSPPEIRAYISLLRNELIERNQTLEHHGLLEYSDLPTAFELSSQCEAVLDQAADVIAERQFRYELKEEKDRFGAWSIIDRQAVFLLKDELTLDEIIVDKMPKQLQSAIKLLKVETMVDLSDQIFMNPNHIGEIREKHARNRITPSITTTAILDFQTLVVSLTKRLVQSSLYFAMSRLRAMENASSGFNRCVRKQDVNAALDVLGMKSFDDDYWPGVARKYSLDVYDEVPSKKHPGVKYSYSQVEQMLKSIHWDQLPSTAEEAPDPVEDPSHFEGHGQEVIMDDDLAFFSDSSANTNNASHTVYANALDVRASRDEEMRLLGLLCDGQTANFKGEEKELPKIPKRKRKSKEDLVDWRDWVGYKSEWERYKVPLIEEDFVANRQKRRRTRSPSIESSVEEIGQNITIDRPISKKDSHARRAESSSGRNSQDDHQEDSVIHRNPSPDQDTDSGSKQLSTSRAASKSPVPAHQRSSASTSSGKDEAESSDSAESKATHDFATAGKTTLSTPLPLESVSHHRNSNPNPQATVSDASTSSSRSRTNRLLPSKPRAGNDIEQDAQARSQSSVQVNAFLHGQNLLPSSSPPAQGPARDSSDSLAEEAGSQNTGTQDRFFQNGTPHRARSHSSDTSESDDGSQELSFGERLAAMRRNSAQDLPLRRFLER